MFFRVFIFLFAIFPSIVTAQDTTDLRFTQGKGEGISSREQYFVSVTCHYGKSLSRYMRALDRKGRYLGYRNRPVVYTRQVAHLVTFTEAPSVSIAAKFANVTATTSGIANPLLVFARDSSSNEEKLIDTSSICSQKLFLHGSNGLYATATLMVSAKPAGTKFIAGMLTFLTAAGGAISQVALNKPISDDKSELIANAQTIVDNYDTFVKKFEGGSQIDKYLTFKQGRNTVRTSFSTVHIDITQVDDYLFPTYIPFRDNASALNPIYPAPAELAGLVQNVDIDETDLSNLRVACSGLNTKMKNAGIHSEYDRTYFLAQSLQEISASTSGLMRCFKAVDLSDAMLDAKANQLINSRLGGDAIFQAEDLDALVENSPTDRKPQTGIPEKLAEPEPQAQSLSDTLDHFFTAYGAFRDPVDIETVNKFLRTSLKRALEPDFYVVDSAGALTGAKLGITRHDIIASFASAGFNRFGCVLERKDMVAPAAIKFGLDQEYFGAAAFLILAHQVERPNFANRNKKLLSPETAMVVRAFLNPKTGLVQTFQTTLLDSTLFFNLHRNCANKLKPQPRVIAEVIQ